MNNEPWAAPAEALLAEHRVERAQGLDEHAVRERRRRHGLNRLREAKPRSVWRILAAQFTGLIVALLAAAAVAFVMRDWVEGMAILAVIAINAALGFFTELKAVRSMEALHRLGQMSARARRAGRVVEIPAAQLVPGDIVLVEGGDVVTADLRLVAGSSLQLDESALTGESEPMEKRVAPVNADAPLAERASMLYKGTAVTRGSGEALVIGTGLDTEIGRITQLVSETQAAATPLERRLDRLARRLVWVTLSAPSPSSRWRNAGA